MTNVQQKDQLYIANTYARFPVTITHGKGAYLYDENGKEYIDMGTGIGVNCFGIADEQWTNAVIEQLKQVQHTSNLYYTKPSVELAETLCNKTGFKKVFFSNSGAEANECAIKVARKYGQTKKGEEYTTIITLVNSFHGRTITTLSATGQEVFHKQFTPLTQGFDYAIANDFESVKQKVNANKVCAIMLECVQGEGGVLPLDSEFIKNVATLCKNEDILLIIDEVQTGNGRTGKLYSYMHFNVMPDIITTAKGLGGGLPIGACLMGSKVENIFTYSDHGSTFGANPVACAGALNIINRLDDNLMQQVAEKSQYIFNELSNAQGVEEVSGLGLMIGIKTTKPSKEIVNKCIEKGVLCLTAKNKVRLLPPLNIPFDTLKKAIEIIKNECK